MLPSIRHRQNKENQPSKRLITEYVKRYPRSQSIREYQPKNHNMKYADIKTQQSDDEMPIRSPHWNRNQQNSALSYDLYRFKQPTTIENEMKRIESYQEKNTQAYLEFIKVKLMQLNLR